MYIYFKIVQIFENVNHTLFAKRKIMRLDSRISKIASLS